MTLRRTNAKQKCASQIDEKWIGNDAKTACDLCVGIPGKEGADKTHNTSYIDLRWAQFQFLGMSTCLHVPKPVIVRQMPPQGKTVVDATRRPVIATHLPYSTFRSIFAFTIGCAMKIIPLFRTADSTSGKTLPRAVGAARTLGMDWKLLATEFWNVSQAMTPSCSKCKGLYALFAYPN